MSYEINSKSDFLTGVSLIVKIPESELDKKALYTIQKDKPDFILPFHYKNIDGQVEFVYQVGAYSKLQYLSGERLTKEYTELWTGIFNPLLDCGDWFMDPYSFMLSSEYLYYDKNKKIVSYVYIPSTKGCSGYAALKEMATEVTRFISVVDTDLENKVLRSIMKDFSPKDFLRMLKSYIAANTPSGTSCAPSIEDCVHTPPTLADKPSSEAVSIGKPYNTSAPTGKPCSKSLPELVESTMDYSAKSPSTALMVTHNVYPKSIVTEPAESKSRERSPSTSGDIIINIPEKGMHTKKKQETRKNKENKRGKKEKRQKKQKSEGSFFDKKRNRQKDVVLDVTKTPQFGNEPNLKNIQVCNQPSESCDVTQNISIEANGARLRYTGNSSLPQTIDVRIEVGEVFTVGRFDTAIGKKQSSFEFEKKTKAISRRHAVIERSKNGYSIIDLSSSAGTFLNGQRIPPNMPCEMGYGCQISFGNAGADYVWEEI